MFEAYRIRPVVEWEGCDESRELEPFLQGVLEERRTQKLDALVEALTPDIALSSAQIAEAQMLSRVRETVLASGDFVPASAIAEAASYSVKNPSAQPNRWKQRGQIFAVTVKGTDLYPKYALGADHRPLPIVGEVLQLFQGKKDGWGNAFWFASGNGYLSGRRPKDLLASDREAVLQAAEMEAVGVQHG